MDAFWSLYEVTRIEKITVKGICEKAGYNRSTFYQYFKDTYDVLDTIESMLLPSVHELPLITLGHKSFGMKESDYLNYFHKKKKYLKVLLSEKGDPSFIHKLKMLLKPSIMLLLNEDNHIPHFDYMIEYILSGMIGVMTYHIQNEDAIDDSELLHIIKELSQGLHSLLEK